MIGARRFGLVLALVVASSQQMAAAQGTLVIDPVGPVPAQVSVSASPGSSACVAVIGDGKFCIVVAPL